MVENSTYRGPYQGPELTDKCKDSEDPTPYCYEEKMFEEQSLAIIREHDTSEENHPLFLMHAFHLLHTPLQVPNYYIKLIEQSVAEHGGEKIDTQNRHLIMAMTLYLDDVVKNLTHALKTK